MKSLSCIVSLLFCFIVCQTSFSQSVAINNTGTAPHPSAMLDVGATNKGLLIPRMNSSQRGLVPSPATGLQVFDTDTKSFWFWNGTIWVELSAASGNLWSSIGANIYNSNNGNVGIGLNTPLAPLHLKAEAEAFRIQGTTPYLSFYDNTNNFKGYLQNYYDDLYLGTPSSNTAGKLQFYPANNLAMTMLANGNVGIGTAYPVNKFQIGDNAFAGYDFGLGNGGGSMAIAQTASLSYLVSSTNISLFPGTSYVGINTNSPQNKLQIGSMGSTFFSTNDFAIGNGTNAMAIQQTNASTVWGSSTDIVLRPRNNNTGNVGVNVLAPTNKLQIGSVGTTGFSTNDLAIGNGTNAMAIYQTDASTLIGSTTDIILRPRNNGAGRVGINTTNPRAPLDVTDFVTRPSSYYSYLNRDAWTLDVRDCQNCVPAISIFASNAVFAAEFDAFSDARIKDIVGRSNGATDLQTINALQITNYTMRDKIKYGNREFKKVIAQQVEKIYPQVVSRHTDFIPNVYQVANEITKVKEGYLLKFTSPHNLSDTAKKLRVLLNETEGMQQVNIVSIPSKNSVVIKAADVKTDKAFVYGEEVNDFRTVDYEGLTTLNISATQELYKLMKAQQETMKTMAEKIEQLTAVIRSVKETRLAVVD